MASDPVNDLYERHIESLSPAERLRLVERIARGLADGLEHEAAAGEDRDAPASRVVVILEDDEERADAMAAQLRLRAPDIEVVLFDNAPDMIRWLPEGLASAALLCLDHDLGPNRQRHGRAFDPATGRVVASVLSSMQPTCPILIHPADTDAALGTKFCLQDAGWTVERVVPADGLDWIATDWIAKAIELLPDNGPTSQER